MMVCLCVHESLQVRTYVCIVLVYCVQACMCILVYVRTGQVIVCMSVFVCSDKSTI